MITDGFHPCRPLRDPHHNVDGGVVTVPYAGQTRMRLTVASGMADAHVRIDPDAEHLIAITHGDDLPLRLRVSASELRVAWPTTLWAWVQAALEGGDRDVEIALHPKVEWSLHFRGGLSRVDADLTAGRIARLDIHGGVSDTSFDLPAATSVVPLRIAGGASEVGLRRPAESGFALSVGGGIAGLRLDEQTFEAIGGNSRLSAGPIHGDAPRYALEISGGASDLQIASR